VRFRFQFRDMESHFRSSRAAVIQYLARGSEWAKSAFSIAEMSLFG
jgi:hypothetical protein